MGFTNAKIGLQEITGKGKRADLELLVDTGALYSMVPASLLKDLGIEPEVRLDFETANGEVIYREVGEARFFYDGRKAISKVIFGEEDDAALLGVVTLEALGLEVDPVRKQVRPTRMILY